MDVRIFNKTISLKDYYCQLDNNEPLKVEKPYVNLYTSLTDSCPAGCEFCCNNNTSSTRFNFEKFKTVILELNKKTDLRKVSFTGGEPTLYPDLLKQCIDFVKSVNSNTFIVINTNGYNFELLEELSSKVNSIALSRHHYDDNVNQQIFKCCKLPSTEDIVNFKNKKVLHFSCNLLKSYISNPNEIIKYLEFCSKVGVNDVGFVSLMQVNDYCKSEFVDFNNLNFDTIKNVFITADWKQGCICRCRNYLYIADNSEIIKIYSRYYIDRKKKCQSNNLMYNGEHLTTGFNGQIIN